MKSFDLVIAGGGMVGVSLALSLSKTDLKIALVDQQSLSAQVFSPDSPYAPRVSALTEASSRLFQRLGAWEAMTSQRAMPYQHMYVWDSEGTGEIAFDARSAGFKTLGNIVENDVVRNALLEQLAKTGVECFPNQSTIAYQLGEPHQVQLDNEKIEARLLVATDGAESRLRKLSGIPSSQKDCLHHAVVTTVETEQYHQDTAWQVFLASGPLAFLPMPSRGEKHFCSIVWSLVPDGADEVLSLDDEAFCQAVECAFESRLGKVLSVDPRFRFPLRQRHARQYHRNRIVLAGDAAHTIHPLAGQGVNLGLQDVEVLSEEIIRAIERGDDFSGSHILNRYERRRMGSNLLMMKSMEGLQNLFAADDIGLRWLRNTGLKWTNSLPFAKDMLIKHALGV
ncbi:MULTISPECIES: FAD-dependent monooxygenase [unclassified Endozoicomonas]|uniref:FAD-dependent monooxygenase n=1 Tax=unclassified Endozoicomonas TaxID=2644528 RepID=UPI003BB61137